LADSPLLGPNGQPLPNPFASQASTSTSLNINTQSAQAALADFSKILANLTSKFSLDWDKATNESLSKQERFYRAIGDKENERRASIARYKNEALSAIDAETKAKLASIDEQMRAGKLAHDQAEKEKTTLTMKASEERKQIEKKSGSAIAREGGVGGFLRNTAAEFGGRIGGPIGSTISSAGALLTNPYALGAMAILEMFNTRAAFAATGANLANAGRRLGSSTGTGLDFTTNLFGMNAFSKLGQALSQGEQRAIVEQMTGSRTMIDQTGRRGGFEAVRNNLGLFANVLPDASKEMTLFVDATKDLGMSQKDITNTFISTRVNADRLKITQLDAIKTQMDMARALRNITNDGAVAASLLFNLSGALKNLGTSENERQRIGLSIAQGGSNLSLSTIAGMSAFVNGGKIPTPEAMFGTGALGISGSKVGILPNVFGLMGQFISKVGGQFKDPTQRMFAADALRQQFMPGLRLQDVPQFFKIAEALQRPGANVGELSKQFQTLEGKTPQAAMADGIQMLTQIVDPIKRLENVFSNFWTMVDAKINKIFQSLGKSVMPFRIEHWVNKNILHKPDATHPSDSHGASGSFK
jgi:hypothetical protein